MFTSSILAKILMGLTVLSFLGGTYLYIQNLQLRVEQAIENQKKLESIVEAKSLVMDRMKTDFENMKKINEELHIVFNDARNDVETVRRLFFDEKGNSRDFTKIAIQKPKELQNRINKGTKYALRCNQIVTGASLIPEDDENNICPDLIKNRKVENK